MLEVEVLCDVELEVLEVLVVVAAGATLKLSKDIVLRLPLPS